MGGKNKQRTKGNIRPSSSGRAAELLARETGVVPGFVGFSTSASNDPGYVPAVQGADEIDSLVDADFRMVLRKLSKRDTVTKLKAVQEFGSMCQERDAEIVKGVLPYWPRIYCRMSLDHDRRVREAAQQAFEQLILKVKRNLAPYLKSIMGHWLISQCDTYPPAASAACVAFQAAFPASKQTEALSFCKDEVLGILQDNLLKETPDTLSDSQSVPEEEWTARHLRLVTSSLLALKKLLNALPQQDLGSLAGQLAHLFAQLKFWKYSKHKNPQIRGAFFEAVSALSQSCPQLLQAEAARACPAVLLSIDDTDPVALPALWEAILHVVSSVPDCWLHVNARKGLLPKLWPLLRDGARGLATVLHPNLLPFVSKLPQEVTEPALHFYGTFFTAIIRGLSSERATSSPSESAAIISATMECLRYAVLQNAVDDEEGRRVRGELLRSQLLPLVDRAMSSPVLRSGPLFAQLTDTLASWEKRAGWGAGPPGEGGTEDWEPPFSQLACDLWEGLGQLCVQHVGQQAVEEGGLVGVAALLQTMRSPDAGVSSVGRKKKAAKISFAGPGDSDTRPEGRDEGGVPESSSPLNSERLEQLVCALAKLTMVHVQERNSEPHLRFLSILLRSFPSLRVFRVLLEPGCEGEAGLGEHGPALARNPAVRFLLHRVVGWLREDRVHDVESLVSMVFSALQCCSTHEEKTVILNHITEANLRWGVLLHIVHKACAEPSALEASAGWLKGPVLGKRLVGLAEELCVAGLKGPGRPSPDSAHTDSWALISLVLSQQLNGGTVIGETYVEGIIDQLHATLSEAKGLSDAGDVEPLVSFICDVASNFFSSMKGCLLLSSAEELLLTLFQLCAQDQHVTGLSEPSLQKLSHACYAGVCSLLSRSEAEVTEGTFLHSAALWVRTQLLTCAQGVKSLQVLVGAVQKLVETLIVSGQRCPYLLSQFITCLTPTQEEWSKMRQALPPQVTHLLTPAPPHTGTSSHRHLLVLHVAITLVLLKQCLLP